MRWFYRENATSTAKRPLWGFLPPPEALTLLQSASTLLKSCFWPIVIIYAVKDLLSFVLHRASQRLTNLGEYTHAPAYASKC